MLHTCCNGWDVLRAVRHAACMTSLLLVLFLAFCGLREMPVLSVTAYVLCLEYYEAFDVAHFNVALFFGIDWVYQIWTVVKYICVFINVFIYTLIFMYLNTEPI